MQNFDTELSALSHWEQFFKTCSHTKLLRPSDQAFFVINETCYFTPDSNIIFCSDLVTTDIKPCILGMTRGLQKLFNILGHQTNDLQKPLVQINSLLVRKSSVILGSITYSLGPYKWSVSLQFINVNSSSFHH